MAASRNRGSAARRTDTGPRAKALKLKPDPTGIIVIDHKSFPGRYDQWSDRALTYAPQLLTYRQALIGAGLDVRGLFVHFMIGGGLVELGADAHRDQRSS